ncbi:MAG: TonB-dependent receptor [Casimicrobium sp.]
MTASRVNEPLGATLRDVSVVDGAALRESGVVDIIDALRMLPGVELSSNGPGATPSIFLRGANSNQTLVLVDGQRIGSSYSGLTALQHINIDQIERIEVLRGPAASLYGADAVGGVIQVFTRRDRSLSMRASIGEWKSQQLSVNAGLGTAVNGISVSLAQNASRGYNAIVNPVEYSYNPDRDGYRFNTVQVGGNVELTKSLSLSASAFETRGKAQYDGDASFDDSIRSVVNNVGATMDSRGNDGWKSTLRVSSGTDKAEFVSAYPGRYATQNQQLSWLNTLSLNSAIRLLGALEWRRESVEGTDTLPVTSRRTQSLLLGADWTQGNTRANATARIDDSNQFGSRSTANASIGYRLSPVLRATVNAGTSFKAPTFNDLYYPGYANPNLKPEHGRSIDASLLWSSAGSKLGATIYQNRVTDLIQFVCDESYNCAPQNVANARLQGLTLTGGTRIAGIAIDASLDFADAKDATADKLLPRRAKQHGAVKFSGDVLSINTGIEITASGQRFDNVSNSRALPGYAVVNVFASKEVMPGLRLGARIENATDRDYQLAYGYATGGRRAWLTLAYNR